MRALFHAGRIERNSNHSWGYPFPPLLVLYEFAPDPQTRARARAGLDWMLLEAALHDPDGFHAGPDSRAKTSAHRALACSVWPYTYLYFIEGTNRPTYTAAGAQAKMNRDPVGFAPWSSYRPPQVLLDIAHRRLALPVEFSGHTAFCDLGHGVYIALVPFNVTSHSSQDYAGDTNWTQLVWSNSPGQLAALTLEGGVRRDHGSYVAFKANVLEQTPVLPAPHWPSVPWLPGAISHTQALSGACGFFGWWSPD